MKDSSKYLLNALNIILIGIISFNIVTYDFESKEIEVSSKNLEKSISSKYINLGDLDQVRHKR